MAPRTIFFRKGGGKVQRELERETLFRKNRGKEMKFQPLEKKKEEEERGILGKKERVSFY